MIFVNLILYYLYYNLEKNCQIIIRQLNFELTRKSYEKLYYDASSPRETF